MLLPAACASGSKAAPTPAVGTATTAAAPALDLPVAPSQEDWRTARPASSTPADPALPTFSKERLPNGVTLLVSEVRSLPIVSFALVVRGGSALDPAGQGGLTALAFAMLDEGAGGRDALAFSDAVADLGASISAGASQDSGTLAISGLSRNAGAMLALLAEAALAPRLDAKDFERVKKLTLASLARQKSSAEGIAFERVPALIYGPNHPYGHPANGTEATVGGLSLAQLKSHLKKLLVPGEATLVAVGNIDAKEAKTLALEHLGRWRGGPAPKLAIPSLEAPPRKGIVLVDQPGANQTMIVVGRPVFGRSHPAEMPMLLTNEVFGGSFASRLNMNLREDKGYTYGAHSAASLRRGVGAFYAMAKVRADVTGASLKEFFGELGNLTARPPSSDEIERARAGLVGSLPGEFERTGAIASAASSLFVYDLPLDYFSAYTARVEQVTSEQIGAIIQAYLQPDRMQILLVGDGSVVRPQLEALGLGAVTVQKP
ncbi:MAG: insulinase family protein [Deltaproteobacteria bacterium]|nr:insulinase family protein [Deltaproteobacteria bacterium]